LTVSENIVLCQNGVDRKLLVERVLKYSAPDCYTPRL
jgi:hypothetical protein